jgi:hypothetical protein
VQNSKPVPFGPGSRKARDVHAALRRCGGPATTLRNNVVYFEYGQATFIVKTELYLDKEQAGAARPDATEIATGRTDGLDLIWFERKKIINNF